MVVFLYKENEDDRDAVKYIDTENIGKFECDHYFKPIGLQGANFWTHLTSEITGRKDVKITYPKIKGFYDSIQTILTLDEFRKLVGYAISIGDLGFGIEKDDARYQIGIDATKAIQPIIDRLSSGENQALAEELEKDEDDYLMSEYRLSEDDIEQIKDAYTEPYWDRGIVSNVHTESDYVENLLERIVGSNDSYQALVNFGAKLTVVEDNCIELDDGRIVSLSY